MGEICEIYEPHAGLHMSESLNSFKHLNKYPLDTYVAPFSHMFCLQDLAERDGIGIWCSTYSRWGVNLTYLLTKDTSYRIDFPGSPKPLRTQETSFLQMLIELFEQYSSTPKQYFMYNYLKLYLRQRQDPTIQIVKVDKPLTQ